MSEEEVKMPDNPVVYTTRLRTPDAGATIWNDIVVGRREFQNTVLVDRVVFKVERGHGPAFWIVSLVAQFVLGILALSVLLVGLWPAPLVDMMNASIEHIVQQLGQSKL